jgi:hypothetical protein
LSERQIKEKTKAIITNGRPRYKISKISNNRDKPRKQKNTIREQTIEIKT